MKSGLIHIYCGDGKGKTTASVGLSIRCAGRGRRVLFFQFLKSNSSGERCILNQIDNITVVNGMDKVKFTKAMTKDELEMAREFYTDKFNQIVGMACGYDIIVMDEIIGAVNKGLVEEDKLLAFLKDKPDELEVVMTGRNPSDCLIEIADYVSEINKIKHPFDKGILARDGIEF